MRLASTFKDNQDMITTVLGLLLSLPGAPVIYYGSEIGMENLALENKFVDSRQYVRGRFDWQSAQAQAQNSDSLLNRVRQIILERSNIPGK